ncbi:MAG TPA: phosphatase PAP2 family protein [Pyrinomonadaceae bacterium]|jgi:undecaprenyl-diphosphatase|nr:phosphatase PAP2 family protein [Pyrinomonadaceae bacterium]
MEEATGEQLPIESARRRLLRRVAASRLWRAQVRYGIILFAFAVLAYYARANAYFAWDRAVAHQIQGLRTPALDVLMYAVSYIGYGLIPYAIAFATFLVFLAARRRSEAYALLFSTAGSGLLNRAIKMLIARPRPAAPDVNVFRLHGGQSFPSGHVTFYVCYFGFLFFVAYALLPKRSLARRLALTLTSLMIALVGISRVYLGAHWPSDTIGAYFLGGLWLGFSLYLYGRWKERSTFHQQENAER